jgi:hypothetical protein
MFRLFRIRYRKYGPPTMPVTMPTGIWTGLNASRAPTSAPTSSAGPTNRQPTMTFL